MAPWHFLALNIVLPVLLLALNIWHRWPSSTSASAGSDWVLLLVGLELTTLGAIGASDGTAFSNSRNLSIWMTLLLPLGVGLWLALHKHFEKKIVLALESAELRPQAPNGHPIKRIRASKGTIKAYTWSIILPAIYAGMNGLIFLGSTAK